MADLARKFPIGSQVRYIGTQGSTKHWGKVGTVVWYVDTNGLVLRFQDGSIGTSTPGKVGLVSLPKVSPDQASALRESLAVLFARVTGQAAEAEEFRRMTAPR